MSDVDKARASELIRSYMLNSTLVECYMGGLSCFPLNTIYLLIHISQGIYTTLFLYTVHAYGSLC
jgi:hypothetical protein